MFSVEDGSIEFVASEEPSRDDSLAMGLYFKHVDLDTVFGRMLDKKMTRRSWITGVDTGESSESHATWFLSSYTVQLC